MLRELMKHHGCDRWEHGYDTIYSREWEHRREEPIRILELGVWHGHGIDVWLEYFPNAEIVGIDVFTRLKVDEVKCAKIPRVTLIEGSSQTPKAYLDLSPFDMIIDDAQHTPRANRKTFESAKHLLKDDGVFYIEDVWPLSIMSTAEKSHPWLRRSPNEYNDKEYQMFLDEVHNGYHVEMFDLREGRRPDSVLFKVSNE